MAGGIFFLVAGPAGVGKTTLLQRLVAEEKGLVKAVSVTTRAPRQGEVDGVSYHFWDEKKFQDAVARGEFLEHACVHGSKHYGTLARFVDEQLAAGTDVVKDIDVQGVEQIRRIERYRYPENLPKVAAKGGPHCMGLPYIGFGNKAKYLVTDTNANPFKYGNQGILFNSDGLKQILFGPLDGPPRNTAQIGQPG